MITDLIPLIAPDLNAERFAGRWLIYRGASLKTRCLVATLREVAPGWWAVSSGHTLWPAHLVGNAEAACAAIKAVEARG